MGKLGATVGLTIACVAALPITARAAGSPTWTQLMPTTLSERRGASIAADDATGQVVLFGGDNSIGVLGDTWVFDGTAWTRLSPAVSPPPRTGGAMAYDARTRTILLFGGDPHVTGTLPVDTWSFDGTGWTELHPAHSPPGRYQAAVGYDPADQELVLFGGEEDTGFGNDTWTFDGTDWAEQATVTSPPVRYGAGAAWDPAGQGLLVFGGIGIPPGTPSPYLGDTWLWSHHAWSEKHPATSPPPRWAPSLTLGPGGTDVLFGGYADSGVSHGPTQTFADTWTWNGSTWAQVTASGPTPRYSAASGWDPTTGHVVLAGGCCNASGGFLTDTWTFDGSAWTRHERSDAPSPRIQVQAVTDTDHHDLVLFGGFGGDGFMADTWTERAGAWQEAQSTTSPVGRAAASIAYDSDHHVTVLFGGQAQSANSCATTPDALNPNHLCNDTWTFDGSSWTRQAQASANGPSYRSLAAMAYDPAAQQAVLYGGFADQATLGDTWTWNGVVWTQARPATSPPPLDGATLTYDPAIQRVVLFGGEGDGPNGPQYFADTWEWDGSTWTQLHPPVSPPAQYAAAATYDPGLGGIVLPGGCQLGDCSPVGGGGTWLFDGTTWIQQSPTRSLPPRGFAAMAFDPTLDADVVFGGSGGDGYAGDTWAYGVAPASVVPEWPGGAPLGLGLGVAAAAVAAGGTRRRRGRGRGCPACNAAARGTVPH